jgi:hypothetical protein
MAAVKPLLSLKEEAVGQTPLLSHKGNGAQMYIFKYEKTKKVKTSFFTFFYSLQSRDPENRDPGKFSGTVTPVLRHF